MNLTVFESYAAMCRQTADEILDALQKNPRLLLCIAAGHTSLGLFEALVESHKQGKSDYSRASFVAMDEWLGMSAATPNSCGAFLTAHFLRHVDFSSQNICLFDGATADHGAECARVERFITEHSSNSAIDFLVLGSGMNGHLALNEPGADWSLRSRVVRLDPVTQQVGQKYFRQETELTGGITLGVANFREARRTVLLVSGENKHGILQRILYEPVDARLPASAVREFAHASLYCDRKAAGSLPLEL